MYLLAHYETPYVVRLWNAYAVSLPQKCFTFNHPKKGTCFYIVFNDYLFFMVINVNKIMIFNNIVFCCVM